MGKDELLEEMDKLPRRLKKLMQELIKPENWSKSLAELCKEKGLNYDSLRTAIAKYGSYKFWRMRSQFVKLAIEEYMPKVYGALLKKAASGDPQTLKLILQWKGELVEKVDATATVNFNFKLDED